MLTKSSSAFVALAAVAVLSAAPLQAATISIYNADGPGEGLNDPTAVSPVGGNTGITLGEQRLIVLQAAADYWGLLLESDVEISVYARFNPMPCDPTSGVLASCGAWDIFRDFPNAPFPTTWYCSALADALAGEDQNPGLSDIITTVNISIDDDPNCLGGVGWYLGLDGNPGGQQHLFPVVLHELAHGLGFQNWVNLVNGTLSGGLPDIYTRFILDASTGEHWNEMTNAERQASAINNLQVAWDGPSAKAAADDWLYANEVDLVVNSPAPIAGTYAARGGLFGAGGGSFDGRTGDMELADDGDSSPPSLGCQPLNGFTPGRIAFLDRGECNFSEKAYHAQQAGAIAAVIANNVDGDALIDMAAGDFADEVTIPAIFISENSGILIRPELPAVNATHDVVTSRGAHANGFPLLYAPLQLTTGSSISHWDLSATPDALMEPSYSPSIFDQVDMTPGLLEDIGWTLVPAENIFADDFESGNASEWSSWVP